FLPVAFINYYPSVVLLNKAEGGTSFWQYLSPVVSLVLLFVGALVWTRGVKRYAGTGN
ncbi:MAG: ABC transporter permease, partial [Lachnospiraceae bacterium]|nr:ABC transporter permease [Lachnospiraceae bacterium]